MSGNASVRPDLRYLDYVNQFVAVLETDWEGTPRFVAFNEYACTFSGRKLCDIVGRSARELFPGHLGELLFQANLAAFETGSQSTLEARLPLNCGTRLMQTSLVPEIGADGKVARVFATSVELPNEDFTPEVQRDRSDSEEFVKLAAHDLRAPVQNMRIISGMLRNECPNGCSDQIELLDMLDVVSDNAMSMLDDIVTLAQSSVPCKPRELVFEFHELARDLMEMLDPFSRSDAFTKTALVSADQSLMQVVLRNLIDNAIKHSCRQKDGDRLSLVFSVEANGADKIDVIVEDNGGGFKNTALLFLNGGALKPGSGFGLLGVRRLVHARGGTIAAMSLPGGRARVRITLPGVLLSGGVRSDRKIGGQLRA